MLRYVDRVTGEVLDKLPDMREPLCTRFRVLNVPVGESRTNQGEREASDVNLIVERFLRTGMLPPARQQGFFGDVSDMNGDLTELHERASKTMSTAKEFLDGREKAAKADAKKAAGQTSGGDVESPQGAPGASPKGSAKAKAQATDEG